MDGTMDRRAVITWIGNFIPGSLNGHGRALVSLESGVAMSFASRCRGKRGQN
jgi:hypothetical protein